MQLAKARSIQFCGAMLLVAGANCVKDLVEQWRLLLQAWTTCHETVAPVPSVKQLAGVSPMHLHNHETALDRCRTQWKLVRYCSCKPLPSMRA